jgi:hypothetical protein
MIYARSQHRRLAADRATHAGTFRNCREVKWNLAEGILKRFTNYHFLMAIVSSQRSTSSALSQNGASFPVGMAQLFRVPNSQWRREANAP